MSQINENTALQLRDNAQQMLMSIKSIEGGVEYLNKVRAIEVWAKAEKKDAELQNMIAEQKIRTQRVLGRLIKEGQERGEIATQQTGRGDSVKCTQEEHIKTLSDIGLTRKQSSVYQKIAGIPEDKFERHIAEKKQNVENAVNELTTAGILHFANTENKRTEEKKFNASGEGTATLYPVDCMQFIYKSDTQYDLLITDPPYMTDVDDIESFVNLWLIEVLKKVKDTGRAYVFIGAYPQELNAYLSKWYQNKLEYLTLENILVWTYKNTIGPSPKDKYKLNWQAVLYFKGLNAPALNTDSLIEKFTVHEINAPDGRLGDRYHTWQKPYEIAELFIRHSTQEGAAVFDPFSGTGTFLLAAKRLNRQAVGCELSADMIAIAQERGVNVV